MQGICGIAIGFSIPVDDTGNRPEVQGVDGEEANGKMDGSEFSRDRSE
jgi:hypothetical protein